MNKIEEKTLSTADFAAAAERRESQSEARREARETQHVPVEHRPDARQLEAGEGGDPGRADEIRNAGTMGSGEQLAPLFLPQAAQQFRSRWDEVQIGFVDDPTQAVRRADELVAQVMKNLAETFAHERENLEGRLSEHDTEHLRVALRRYRSFFQRLLSL